eukprot:scaffold2940_cov63-Phaeocystis_antarctica.AAC.2
MYVADAAMLSWSSVSSSSRRIPLMAALTKPTSKPTRISGNADIRINLQIIGPARARSQAPAGRPNALCLQQSRRAQG